MRISKISLIILPCLFLAACLPNVADRPSALNNGSGGSSGSGGTAGSTDSITAFTNTLRPVLQTNCQACHGVFQAPMFATGDASASHDVLINGNYVNLNNPNASAIVTKVDNGHNGIPQSVAADMAAQIQAWEQSF